MGIASSLFAKPVSKALVKSAVKQADAVVPKLAAEVAQTVAGDVPLPTKSLVTRKARDVTSNPVVKEEPVVAPKEDIDTGINTDPLFKDEEAVSTPVVDDVFMPPKVDRTEDFGVEPELIAESGTDAFEALGLSAEKKEVWRKQNKASQRSKLLPEIEEAAQKLFERNLKPEEFRKLSAEKQPIVPLDKVPDMPSFTDIAGALTEAQVNKGIVGLNMKIAPGERVSSRLDIPAYNDYNTWIVSLHEGNAKSGAPIGYAKTAVLKNVEFVSDPKVALDIARRKPLGSGGRMGKATIARIFGDYVPHNPDNAKAYAEKIFNDPEWTQVGMNPYRASYFYDKADNMPVISADEIVQIGPLVMAKNVKKTKPDDALFRVNKKDDASPTFAKGGVVNTEMNKLFAEGGVMQEGGTVDPVSGNDVPPGAMAEEVRDDIDAKLSEGEFVIPADVVRYIGLEKLMMLRDKAKAGLKRMSEIGQMGNAEEVPDAEALHSGEDEMDDETFSSEIDSIMSEEGKQEYSAGGDVRKYAPGGYVGGEANKELYQDAPIRGFEMVAMTNDAGQTIYIPFINGKAQLAIPQGYKVKSSDVTTTTGGGTTGSAGSGGATFEGGGGGTDGGGSSDGTPAGPASAGISMNADGSVTANTVSPAAMSLAGLALSAVTGLPALGMLGKNIAEMMNFEASQQQVNVTVAQADTTNPANEAPTNAPTATATQSGGPQGTGGAAASAGASAAAAASAAGHSDAAIAAAAQAAADATIGGLSPAQAAEQGNAAAVSVSISESNVSAANAIGDVSMDASGQGANAGPAAPGGGEAPSADGGVGVGAGTGGASAGDSGDGGTGAASSAGDSGSAAAGDGGSAGSAGDGGSSGDGGAGWAKGGFVSKKKTKTLSKSTGLASRRK